MTMTIRSAAFAAVLTAAACFASPAPTAEPDLGATPTIVGDGIYVCGERHLWAIVKTAG